MKLTASLLSLSFLFALAANGEPQRPWPVIHNLYYYNPFLPIQYPLSSFETRQESSESSQVHPFFKHGGQKSPNKQQGRPLDLFFDGALFSQYSAMRASRTTTVTTTSTSTFTTTCTKSTTACSGRRRREAILADLIDHQQHVKIDPTSIHPVETTLSAGEMPTNREGRLFHPYFPNEDASGVQSSGLDYSARSLPYHSSPSSYFLSYLEQLMGQNRKTTPELGSGRDFDIFYSLISLKRHTTTTCTVFTISTFTSSPGCSVSGLNLAQCPN